MKIHPAVNLTMLLSIIVLTAMYVHPVLSALSLAAALVTCSVKGHLKKAASLLRFILPVGLLVIVVNSVFNGNGVTVLFTIFSKYVMLEAVMFGVFSAVAMSAAVIWAYLLGEMLTADEIVSVFGRVSPYLALLLSMVLGLIPTMLERLREIRELRRAEGDSSTKVHLMGDITALVFQSLEQALETSVSMRARGFGCGKPVRLKPRRMRGFDVSVLVAVLLLTGGEIALTAVCGKYSFYPIFTPPEPNAQGLAVWLCFALLSTLPLMLELKELAAWKFLMSKT